MSAKKILVVDDEQIILDMLDNAFSKVGYSVYLATNAREALEILEQESIPLMFIDLGLEKMNGFEFCERIRENNPQAIIYALTGFAVLFGPKEILEAGFDGYLGKPVKLKELYQIAKDSFEKLDRLSEIKPIKRILVVDDDDQFRKMLSKMLKTEGYEVTEAANGNKAIEQHSAQSFDLIITDIIMPDKEGIEVIVEIKDIDPKSKFIVVSGANWYGSDVEFEVAKTLGAQVLQKPFEHEALLEAIKQIQG